MNNKYIKIERLEVGQLKANCYLLMNIESGTCLIVDPGDDADYIVRRMNDFGVKPLAVLATHGHFDHVMAATELTLGFKIPFAASKKDSFLLKRAGETARYFTDARDLPAPGINIDLDIKEDLNIGKFKLSVIKTPGHTPGSVSFALKDERAVFVGDLMFERKGKGRADFKYSDKRLLENSIDKVKKLPGDTFCYPGHGEPFYLKGW